jgi:hypothetical protein
MALSIPKFVGAQLGFGIGDAIQSDEKAMRQIVHSSNGSAVQ